MSKDGRLTIRFGELLKKIELTANKADRDPSDWVRVQIKRVFQKRQAKGRRRAAKAA